MVKSNPREDYNSEQCFEIVLREQAYAEAHAKAHEVSERRLAPGRELRQRLRARQDHRLNHYLITT